MNEIHATETHAPRARRIASAGLIAALCIFLTACILVPGKFTSSLDLRKDGRFTFAYNGEIHFVSPKNDDQAKSGNSDFEPQPCSAANGVERKCSARELDEQRRTWEDGRQQARNGEAAQMSAMMGGVDLSDPAAAEEFARKLARQHGWRSVKSMGKGRFDVDYAISGTLTHDFTFPVMEDFALANPFVQVILRGDGSARIVAPGYSNGAAGSPLKGLAQMGAMDEAKESGNSKSSSRGPQLPRMEGTFTVTTDAAILANNTDEGPRSATTGSQMSWTVNDRTDNPPTALINLVR